MDDPLVCHAASSVPYFHDTACYGKSGRRVGLAAIWARITCWLGAPK